MECENVNTKKTKEEDREPPLLSVIFNFTSRRNYVESSTKNAITEPLLMTTTIMDGARLGLTEMDDCIFLVVAFYDDNTTESCC